MADDEIGGYRFRDPGLLATALTHSSYLHEHPDEELEDFERLEFLGDAVVDLVIGELLYRNHPEATEGELTAMRAQLVSGPPLSQLAQRLGLPDRARLGRGETDSGGRQRVGLGAGLYESVLGAVYVDGGFEPACEFVLRTMKDTIVAAAEQPRRSPKTVLQEWAQGHGLPLPAYDVAELSGPEHAREFLVDVTVGDLHARGAGRSKREAQENAASALIEATR
ncbi:MAG TPA: ribonuclease III [Chloroflexi bacterium]|jgi:ribonuclease-3|nr:ribonuclease III [Chloroflexota bacterium]HAL28900.1 ribonuclease III [Chloroflexota bacterium]